MHYVKKFVKTKNVLYYNRGLKSFKITFLSFLKSFKQYFIPNNLFNFNLWTLSKFMT